MYFPITSHIWTLPNTSVDALLGLSIRICLVFLALLLTWTAPVQKQQFLSTELANLAAQSIKATVFLAKSCPQFFLILEPQTAHDVFQDSTCINLSPASTVVIHANKLLVVHNAMTTSIPHLGKDFVLNAKSHGRAQMLRDNVRHAHSLVIVSTAFMTHLWETVFVLHARLLTFLETRIKSATVLLH